MDEQIMDCSGSKTGGSDNEFTVLTRSSVSTPMGGGSGVGDAPRAWNSVDSKSMPSPVRSYVCLSSIETDKAMLDKAQNADVAAIASEIDHALKRHTDNMLHAIDGLGARLSKVETRMRELERSVDDMKHSIGNNHGSTCEKVRQMDCILPKVQPGTRYLENKQEVIDVPSQLEEKSQICKADKSAETQDAANIDPPATQHPTQQPQTLPPLPAEVRHQHYQPSPPRLELPMSHHSEEAHIPSQTSPSNFNGVMVDGEDEVGISGSLVGATRKTLNEMHDLYRRHASSLGFSIRKNTSRKHPIDGIVREKYYCCSCEGKMNDKSDDIRKRKKRRVPVTRTGCGAFLRVKLNKAGEYEVVAHVTAHNHSLTRRE